MDPIRRGRDVAIWLVLCAGIVTGCGIPGDPPARTAEAEQHARGVVARIVTDLQVRGNPGTRTADQIGRALAVRTEADLIAISGTDTAHPAGVTAVIRIEGSGTDGSWLEPEWVVEDFCFELRFAPTAPTSPPTVPCPSPAPRLTFPPLKTPELPSPDQLRTALSNAADEAGVRAALARLPLDPMIRVDVAAQGETLGVALRAPDEGSGGYGCVFARRRGETVEAWRPAAVQLQPGELACVASEGIAGHGREPLR